MEAEVLRATSCSTRDGGPDLDQQQQTNSYRRDEGAFLVAAFLEEVFFLGRSVLENPLASLARCARLLLAAAGVVVPGLSLALLCSASRNACREGKSCPFTSEMTPNTVGIRNWAGS